MGPSRPSFFVPDSGLLAGLRELRIRPLVDTRTGGWDLALDQELQITVGCELLESSYTFLSVGSQPSSLPHFPILHPVI